MPNSKWITVSAAVTDDDSYQALTGIVGKAGPAAGPAIPGFAKSIRRVDISGIPSGGARGPSGLGVRLGNSAGLALVQRLLGNGVTLASVTNVAYSAGPAVIETALKVDGANLSVEASLYGIDLGNAATAVDLLVSEEPCAGMGLQHYAFDVNVTAASTATPGSTFCGETLWPRNAPSDIIRQLTVVAMPSGETVGSGVGVLQLDGDGIPNAPWYVVGNGYANQLVDSTTPYVASPVRRYGEYPCKKDSAVNVYGALDIALAGGTSGGTVAGEVAFQR